MSNTNTESAQVGNAGESGQLRAGFVGLGLMGLPMATNLLHAGWA